MRERRTRPAAPGALVSFVGYAVIFALFSIPWLLSAHRGAPRGFLGNAADERLVVWVLAWVAHAIATGARVVDANINYPAPAQLTGTEHFLSFQILFAPLYALTGNALLAANVTVFLTYPLAALAMQRLLLALGCAASVAWVVGLIFALGPFRVPGHLHLLQYTNLFLPLVALALTRLRERPSLRTALLLGLALAMGVLSSYYMAVLCGILALVWGLFELCRRGGSRARFVVLAAGTAAVVALALLLVSQPYLARPEVVRAPIPMGKGAALREAMSAIVAQAAIQSGGKLVLVLAGLGVVGLVLRDGGARLTATRGIVLTVLAQLTAFGSVVTVDGTRWPTPFALILMSPLRFFRYPMRFAVLLGFGTALLGASLLQSIHAGIGRRAGRAAVTVVTIAILATQAWRLSGTGIATFSGQIEPAYEMVARVTRAQGGGPLLELPMVDPMADKAAALGTEAEAMLGSTRHWLPLVTGFTGYQPPHRPLVLHQSKQLPDESALQRLVDLTHLRWLLLRPLESWPEAQRAQREEIRKSKLFKQVAASSGWLLLRVRTKARTDKWFDAIGADPQPGETLLGTPLAAIAEADAVAVVKGTIQATMTAGGMGAFLVTVKNAGVAAWPVSVTGSPDGGQPLVRLVLEWWPTDRQGSGAPLASQSFPLPLDVEPGDEIGLRRWAKALGEPGEYDVRFRIEQIGGATFSDPRNEVLSAPVRVAPKPGT